MKATYSQAYKLFSKGKKPFEVAAVHAQQPNGAAVKASSVFDTDLLLSFHCSNKIFRNEVGGIVAL